MNKTELKNYLIKNIAPGATLSRKDFAEIAEKIGIPMYSIDNLLRDNPPEIKKVGWGKYSIVSGEAPESYEAPPVAAPPAPAPVLNLKTEVAVANRSVHSISDDEVFVPKKDPTYIKWGDFNKIKDIVKSKVFFPIYIAGMSGNGKTMMVEQACAITNREYVRVQISPETDEDDLIGGFRLINGETVFQKGPIIKAMERGSLLLIDEIDRATNKIMCLQGVLEGKPILLKKTGEVITPADGFNVIGTANTKGQGSDDGRYASASVLDEAFLERFVGVIEQKYPTPAIERKILTANAKSFDVDDSEFIEKLVAWSNVIRKTYAADAIDDVISTRRLVHIVKAFSIFKDRMTAINMCIGRFDDETREPFLDLYTKIDESQLDENGEIVDPNDPNKFENEESPF